MKTQNRSNQQQKKAINRLRRATDSGRKFQAIPGYTIKQAGLNKNEIGNESALATQQ